MNRRALIAAAIAVLAAAGCGSPTAEREADDAATAERIVAGAAATVTQFRGGSAADVVNPLLAKAKGAIIAPNIVRAALIGGGSGGVGVLVGRDDQGAWSSPAFVSFGGASFGLQAGVTSTSVLAIIMNDQTMRQLENGEVVFGATAKATAVTADQAGATAQPVLADTATDIFYFTQTEGGAFAGVNLGGTWVKIMNERNAAFYGRPATATEIVRERSIASPDARPLQQALAR
jgi:lipid-binding SYLF domain-containing protein